MSTEVTFPPVVKGSIKTAVDLPTEVRGTIAGTARLSSTVFRESDHTRLDNQVVPAASTVDVDVWYPDQPNRTIYVVAGDLRAIARALTEHADALEQQTGTEIL